MYGREDTHLMVQVARLYYQNHLNQVEIADQLELTRQKVSRLLIAARIQGIIRTVILDPYPADPDLEREVKDRFSLHDVVLAPGDILESSQLRTAIGLTAVDYLKQALRDDQMVGIGWGRTLFETVKLFDTGVTKRIHVIPLIGGIGDISPYFQVNELARSLAEAFNGTYRHLYAPAFIENNTILENLLKTQEVTQVLDYWSRLDVAIVGIGQVELQHISSMFFANHITPRTLAQLESCGTVGDICARFYNLDGDQVFPEMGVIGINLDQLKTIPEVIAIAGGMEKVRALLGALRGGYIKTLITDTATARAVLAADQERR